MPEAPKEKSTRDFYFENGWLVFTAEYHLKRGYCCGSGCRHCPFEPRHTKRSLRVEKTVNQSSSE